MTKHNLLTFALGVGLATASYLSAQPQRAPERGRSEQAKREYHFRAEDQAHLREHYRSNFHEHDRDRVDVGHRARFVVGGHLPRDWKARVHPVPAAIYRE